MATLAAITQRFHRRCHALAAQRRRGDRFVGGGAHARGGGTEALVVAQVGASSESMLTGLVPQLIPLERFFGGEYAKKVLTEALARGWEITNKK